MISNIKTVEGGSIDAKNALYLKGFEDAPIENIVLEDAVLNGVRGEAVLQNIKNLTFRNVFINGEKIEDEIINVDNNFNVN